jgi:polyisoprenoid-binding protein YceI
VGRLKWILIVPVALVALGVAGSFVYVTFIADDAPDRLSLDATEASGGAATTTAPTGSTAASGVDGTWTVGDGSQAGYRVEEILFGQSATAVGRTSDVSGQIAIEGTTAVDGSFEVRLANVTSDESRRDNQFRGRIMDVASHPTATFTLTQPIDFAAVPADGAAVNVEATGELTLRGTTKTVTIPLEAKRNAERIEVAGRYRIVFDEWNIPSPSFGPAEVGDEGELEFLLVLSKV